MSLSATVSFRTREDADAFAIAYTRFTLKGHSVDVEKVIDGIVTCDVGVYDIDDKAKEFIDAYVKNKNETKKPTF